jgi:hypothetical protein
MRHAPALNQDTDAEDLVREIIAKHWDDLGELRFVVLTRHGANPKCKLDLLKVEIAKEVWVYLGEQDAVFTLEYPGWLKLSKEERACLIDRALSEIQVDRDDAGDIMRYRKTTTKDVTAETREQYTDAEVYRVVSAQNAPA